MPWIESSKCIEIVVEGGGCLYKMVRSIVGALLDVGIKKLTEIDLKNVLTAEVNKGDGVDDWDNFNTSFNRIMKDYVSNMGVYDKKWLSKSSKMPAKDFKKHVN